MRKEITTEQLTINLKKILTARCDGIDPSQPNLRFCPTVESCDGPSRCAQLRFHTYPWMANPMNVTHGGMISAILDASMGVLCFGLYGVMTPTITMTTNYCRPVPLDTDILVRVRLSYPGGTSAQLSADMYLSTDLTVPLATATGVYYTAQADKK